MAELKTKVNDASIEQFINKIADEEKRSDSRVLVKMMKQITKQPPKIWGPSIVGFGSYHYKYASGREGDMCLIGFSPRKEALTLYGIGGLKRLAPLLKKLGKHKTGKGCLYIKTLNDVDLKVLEGLFSKSFAQAGR